MQPLRSLGLVLGFALVAWVTGCGAKMSGSEDAPAAAGMGGSTASDINVPSCRSGPDDLGLAGKQECGGCSYPSFRVLCTRHVVPVSPDTLHSRDKICAFAQAAFGAAGAGGAPS